MIGLRLEERPLPLTALHEFRPHFLWCHREDDLRRRRHHDPVTPDNLRLELARAPAGVAGERTHALARYLALERARESLLAGQHADVVEHRLGAGERLVAADEGQERRGQHRAAAPQAVGAVLHPFELRQDLRQLDGRRLVDDDAHRTLVPVVGDEQHHALREVRILLVRGRHQHLALGRTPAGSGRGQVAPVRPCRSRLRTGEQAAREGDGDTGTSHRSSDSRDGRA